MSYLFRLACCCSLLALIGACCYIFRPFILEDMGFDFWELSKWQCQIDAESKRDQGLSDRMDAARHRYEARVRIGQELLASRISLAEAVLQTKELGGVADNYLRHLRRIVAGQTDEERFYRHVIDWTCDCFRDHPEQAERLRRRLLGELDTFLRNAPAQT
jgi:hypothetical protein